ncbi:hypothetical protein LR013_05625 [candidate division NPL-UPA2 bacterium]|nr:hypothetical protein [candidate division NPL-UPA2 bacterium]
MDIQRMMGSLKTHLKILGEAVPAGIPWGGPIYAQYLSLYLSQKSSEELREIFNALKELRDLSDEQLDAIKEEFKEELQKIDIATKQRIAQTANWIKEALDKEQQNKRLNSAFLIAEDKFNLLIKSNFLEGFDGTNNPDYLQLLPADFMYLLFSFFNIADVICIHGKRGVGKTFNSLLFAKKIQQEGFKVYYNSVKRTALSEEIFSELRGLIDKNFVFIIDDCQEDVEKTEAILERISGIKSGRPKVFFLIRNDGAKRGLISSMMETFKDLGVRILNLKEKYIDLNFLAGLFFHKINMDERLQEFLSAVKRKDLSKALFESKNMEFWNMFFKQLERGLKKGQKIRMDEATFYNSAYEYFLEREPHLIECKDVLSKLVPLFKNDLAVPRDYVQDVIEAHPHQYQRLLNLGIITLHRRDWGNGHEIFIESNLHSTKAEVLEKILIEYEHILVNKQAELINFITRYPDNLYDIIMPFYFHRPQTLNELCRNDSVVSELQRYLRAEKLGKRLDRIIKTLSVVEDQIKEDLINDEILDSLGEKLNTKGRYLVSRVYLFRAMKKFSRIKNVQLYKRFNHRLVIEDFGEDPRGIYSFAKLLEPLKDIVLDCGDDPYKEEIIAGIKEILDGCREKFIEKFAKHHYFTQLHLILKRLNRIRLGVYFLAGIPPAKILEWIRTKDTNIVELRYLLLTAKYMSTEIEGVTMPLYNYFQNALSYTDIERIFNNRRSHLNDIAIVTMYHPRLLASHFYQYSLGEPFVTKIKEEKSLYRVNQTINALEKLHGLSEEQRSYVIARIIQNLRPEEEMLRETRIMSRRMRKDTDIIEQQKQQFLEYKKKFSNPA